MNRSIPFFCFIAFFLITNAVIGQPGISKRHNHPSGFMHTISAGVNLPLGNFSSTHVIGAIAEYTWSNHRFGQMDVKPVKPIGFVANAGIAYYFGKKETSADGNSAIDECSYTREEIERITHKAFQYAKQRRNKLTLVDKANVLETSRLWRKVVQEIAQQYTGVAVNYMFVDNAAMQIILNPKQFDVILTENMFGDIISDEASVLSGSLGLLPSASVGNKTALFEPIRGSYPQAAGKDIANPLGSILSTAMLLDYFGMKEEAETVREAVNWTLENSFVTKDIDPVNFYFTSTIGELLCDYISGKIPGSIKKENIELRKSTII